MILVGIITSFNLPIKASLGYWLVFAWIIFLFYLIFYRKDKASENIEKLLK